MHIPEQLQPHVEHGALLILSDMMHGNIWYAAKDSMEEVGGFTLPATLDTDHEGSFVNTDNGSVSGTEPSDNERLRHYIVMMKEELTKQLHAHPVKYIHLVMPARVSHVLRSHLSPEETDLLGRHLDDNLMKVSVLDVLKKLFTI